MDVPSSVSYWELCSSHVRSKNSRWKHLSGEPFELGSSLAVRDSSNFYEDYHRVYVRDLIFSCIQCAFILSPTKEPTETEGREMEKEKCTT